MSDNDLWSVCDCWWDFVLWQWRAYHLHDDDWEDWGFYDACNLGLPYAKVVNGSFLVTYGLSDNHDLQWHGSIDYQQAAQAWGSAFHAYIQYEPTEDRILASSEPGDHTHLGCLLFDASTDARRFDDPAMRAAAYVHEGWHHWQDWYGYDASHMPCQVAPNRTIDCDWYYWHTVGRYEFGDMWHFTTDGELFHSPYQANTEFFCDTAELSQWFVPTSVRTLAQSYANAYLATVFRNPIGYRCGDPRPW